MTGTSIPGITAPTPASLSPAQRWLSLAEFAVAAAIVIAHNVYHALPNEVPILFVLGVISVRWRNRSWIALSRLPVSWKRTVLFALAAAAVRIMLGAAIEPIGAHFWPPIKGPSGSDEIQGHILIALQWLAIVWTFAAVGEEVGYRGYLLERVADILGGSKAAYWAAACASALLFGYGHYYKGPAGIVDSGMAGLVLAAAYILSGRNLWVCILAHGFIDTFGVVAAFLGLDT